MSLVPEKTVDAVETPAESPSVREARRIDPQLEQSPWTDDDLLATYFNGCRRIEAEVDLKGEGPSLEVRFSSGDREARITIPAADAPAFLWNLPPAMKRAERLRDVKVLRTPVRPEIRAEYDAEGRLLLLPMYTVRGEALDPLAIEKGLAGTGWYFDGRTYHPL